MRQPKTKKKKKKYKKQKKGKKEEEGNENRTHHFFQRNQIYALQLHIKVLGGLWWDKHPEDHLYNQQVEGWDWKGIGLYKEKTSMRNGVWNH